jgi:hypothetical protein
MKITKEHGTEKERKWIKEILVSTDVNKIIGSKRLNVVLKTMNLDSYYFCSKQTFMSSCHLRQSKE